VSALVWWAIPLLITALAIAIVALRSRISEPRSDPMAERVRLREAMERSSGFSGSSRAVRRRSSGSGPSGASGPSDS